MIQVVEKKILAENIISFKLKAKDIALKARPGQFIILIVDEKGERIPLTIVQKDPEEGIIKIIFQVVGKTTKHLSTLDEGDFVEHVVGPLGHETEIKFYGNIIIVGGGVGIAEILPVTQDMKKAGNRVETIIGVRTKDLLILEKEMAEVSDVLYVMTDDGSYGIRGFVTEKLKDLIESNNSKYDLVYAVGPVPMMKAVCQITKEKNIKTIVSLNSIMVDGTGMCGSCRVSIGGETKCACVDGPEFDGHLVDWDELIKRLKIFEKFEKISYEKYIKEHKE